MEAIVQKYFPNLLYVFTWGLVGLVFFLLTSCQTDKKIYPEGGFNATTVTEIHSTNAWSYDGETGPEHWSELSENEECSGSHQSPINIIAVNAQPSDHAHDLVFNYASGTHIHDVVNNGHTIKYNFEPGDFIEVGEQQFDLIQVHFHEPAEHTINGVRYPMEMHMVHINDENEFAVIAVMVEEGNSSETFDFLEHYLPVRTGQTKPIDKAFDLNLSLPNHKSYYYYHGSLTTPPCTESVEWFVMKDPISISLDQVKIMQALMPLNNYRNEQPLNDRIVYLVEEHLPI